MSTKNNQNLVSAVNVEPLHQDEANKLSGGFQTLESTNATSDSEATNVGYCGHTHSEDTNICVCM